MVKQSCCNLHGTSSPVVLNYSPLWICCCAVTEFVCLVRANLACDQVSFLSVTFKWTNLILLLLLLSFHPASSCSSLLVPYKGQHQLPILRKRFATMNRFAAARWFCEIMTPPDESSFQRAKKKKKEEKREKANTAASKQQQDRRVTACISWSSFIQPFIKTKEKFHGYAKESSDWLELCWMC